LSGIRVGFPEVLCPQDLRKSEMGRHKRFILITLEQGTATGWEFFY